VGEGVGKGVGKGGEIIILAAEALTRTTEAMAKLRSYFRDAARAVERAPAEAAIALVTAIELSYAIESHSSGFSAWVELATGNLMALLIAWSATMLYALDQISVKVRWTITLAGVLFSAWYELAVVNTTMSEGWRALMLLSAFALIALAVPALVRSSDEPNLRLRRINGRLLLRTFAIGVYGLALFAGLALALKAVDTLFELNMDEEIYGHVFGWIAFAVVPWVVIGGLNDYIRPLEQRTDVAGIIHRLVAYLVPPLLALYYIILYAYATRIGVTGEFPNNLVSPMVLAAAGLGALAIVIFDPRPEDPPGMRALRFAPPLFLPLGLLGIWAIRPRVGEYGWTEFRLLRIELLILFLLLAALGTIQLLRRRTFSLRIIPVVLAAGLLVTAVGPWSILAISKRDQRERLAFALRQAEVNPDVPVAPGDTARRQIGAAVYDQIQGTSAYLQQHFGEEAFVGILPPHAVAAAAMMQLPDYYGLARLGPPAGPRGAFTNLPEFYPVPLPDGASAYRVSYRAFEAHQRTRLSGDTLRFGTADSLRVDLGPLLRQLRATTPSRDVLPADRYAVPVLDRNGARRGTLLIFTLGEGGGPDEPVHVIHLDGLFVGLR